MKRCRYFKVDGIQCNRKISQKLGKDHIFCWQHQKCQKKTHLKIKSTENSNKLIQNKSIIEQKRQERQEQQMVNSFKPISRKLKVLSGPSYFVFFPNVLEKRILLIGEYHNIQGICPDDYYDILQSIS
jgi:hypothetical protein